MINVCIVNRNFPPYRGATGYHASQLADYLLSTDRYRIDVVTLGDKDTQASPLLSIHTLRPAYNGRDKLLRLGGNMLEGYRLIRRALSLEADFYIIMTDPPLLNYWAARLMKSQNWGLWTMDLYPQGFIAGRLAGQDSIHVRHYNKVLRSGAPDLLITLGAGQRAYLAPYYGDQVISVHIPIGLTSDHTNTIDYPAWYNPDKITIGYVGNLSEAHDPAVILSIIHNMDLHRMQFILSCYGVHARSLKSQVADLSYVTVLDKIDDKHMPLIDVQVVSLKRSWTHICVPSKALSALDMGRPVLYVGDPLSDTATYIADGGWTITDIGEVPRWIERLTQEEIERKASNISPLRDALHKNLKYGWQQIDEFISSTHVNG